jgi:hypothetical protein
MLFSLFSMHSEGNRTNRECTFKSSFATRRHHMCNRAYFATMSLSSEVPRDPGLQESLLQGIALSLHDQLEESI